MTGDKRHYDVVIAGAGPAGTTCALALKDAGLKVLLLDKESFPRDKICGDAIPTRAIKTLRSISPVYADAFAEEAGQYRTRQTYLFYNGRNLPMNWVGEAYTSTRMVFDNFLFNLVGKHTDVEVLTKATIHNLVVNAEGVSFSIKETGQDITARMIVGADGAHSPIAKQLTARTMDRDHHIGSVRAYYSGVAGMQPNVTEMFFEKRFLPSYLWVFPLPDGKANVGFGMVSREIVNRKVNLKKAFYEFIEGVPQLKERFKDAEQISSLDGFGLPLGSRRVQISGDSFLLVGDAASLIDPISGEGIGNAMFSGKTAAAQIIRSFKAQRFDAKFMVQYDEELFAKIGAELKLHYRIQVLLSRMPFVLDIAYVATRNRLIRRWVNKLM